MTELGRRMGKLSTFGKVDDASTGRLDYLVGD